MSDPRRLFHARDVVGALAIGVAAAAAPAPALANVDLELRPVADTVEVGETVRVGLYAVSDDETEQLFAAMEVIFAWDPAFVRFLDIDGTGGVALLRSQIPFPDSSGLNESDPPADGDGLYIAWAPLAEPIAAPPEGVLVTTFLFEALAPTASTAIDFVPERNGKRTVVFDGEVPGLDVTGRLVGAWIEIVAPCPEDLDGSGDVDFEDILRVLDAWGNNGGAEDLDGSGTVDFADLLIVLDGWGPCGLGRMPFT